MAEQEFLALLWSDDENVGADQKQGRCKRAAMDSLDVEPFEKKQKQAECLTSTTWARRLAEALSHPKESRGKQLRPLRITSSCSGLGSHCRGLQDLSSRD